MKGFGRLPKSFHEVWILRKPHDNAPESFRSSTNVVNVLRGQ